jgi:hypothetical protein
MIKKKGRESNWEFEFQPQILLEQGFNDFLLRRLIHCWKDPFEGYKVWCSHVPKKLI